MSADPQGVDLAARRLGGMVLAANDEFFAPKENLLDPRPPVFDPSRYSDRGKEMDGWETRRRRGPGHDWCVVRLGLPGVVREVVVDTSFFRGNYPERCALDGCYLPPDAERGLDWAGSVPWIPLLGEVPLQGDTRMVFPVDAGTAVTHLRLSIHPDGGVARLRAHGDVVADLPALAVGAGALDLASVLAGATVVDASDRFFGAPENLLMVGDAKDMSDGWETRRRRGPGSDWVVVRLAAHAHVERIEIDTTNFKGNHPDSCWIDGRDTMAGPDQAWTPLVAPTPLRPHARHLLRVDGAVPVDQVRLTIAPDGGVSRLRVYGRPTDAGWDSTGIARLDALPADACARELLRCCGSTAWARSMAGERPFRDVATLLSRADALWEEVSDADRLEAFVAHPRIGERTGSSWSRAEQAAAAAPGAETEAALADGNRRYEERFGHVFLIRAAGRSADEILAALRERLQNDAATELRIAADEQREITGLRLRKLLRPDPA